MSFLISVTLVVLGGTVLYFSRGLRAVLAQILVIGGIAGQGIGRRVWPYLNQIPSAIWQGGKWFLLANIIFAVVVVLIGNTVYAGTSAWVIAVFLPVWSILFVLPRWMDKIWIAGPIMRWTRRIVFILLIPSFIFLVTGVWSPEVKESLNHYTETSKQWMANWLTGESNNLKLDLDNLAQTTAIDVNIYDDNNSVVKVLRKKGELILTFPDKIKNQPGKEMMIYTTCQGPGNDFISGTTSGWIVYRFLNFNWKQVSVSTASPASKPGKWGVVRELTFTPKYWDEVKQTSFFPAATLGPGTYRVNADGISNFCLSSGRLVPVPPEGKMITRNKRFGAGIIIPTEQQGMLIGNLEGVPGMSKPFPIGKRYSFTVPEGKLAVFYLTANLNERWGNNWARVFAKNEGPGWNIKISKLQIP